MKIIIDSGASDSVALPGIFPVKVYETAASRDGLEYTRATGKMSMVIAQNGPGITGLVTPIKTAYWNHTPLLLVTPQAANKTMGQGGFQAVSYTHLTLPTKRIV